MRKLLTCLLAFSLSCDPVSKFPEDPPSEAGSSVCPQSESLYDIYLETGTFAAFEQGINLRDMCLTLSRSSRLSGTDLDYLKDAIDLNTLKSLELALNHAQVVQRGIDKNPSDEYFVQEFTSLAAQTFDRYQKQSIPKKDPAIEAYGMMWRTLSRWQDLQKVTDKTSREYREGLENVLKDPGLWESERTLHQWAIPVVAESLYIMDLQGYTPYKCTPEKSVTERFSCITQAEELMKMYKGKYKKVRKLSRDITNRIASETLSSDYLKSTGSCSGSNAEQVKKATIYMFENREMAIHLYRWGYSQVATDGAVKWSVKLMTPLMTSSDECRSVIRSTLGLKNDLETYQLAKKWLVTSYYSDETTDALRMMLYSLAEIEMILLKDPLSLTPVSSESWKVIISGMNTPDVYSRELEYVKIYTHRKLQKIRRPD